MNRILKLVIILLVLLVVWWGVGVLLTAFGAPSIIGTVFMVLLVLGALVFILKEFGLWRD